MKPFDCIIQQRNTTDIVYFSHQPVCYCQETLWNMSAQILALAPAPLVNWMTVESSCCKQVWDMHIDIPVSVAGQKHFLTGL